MNAVGARRPGINYGNHSTGTALHMPDDARPTYRGVMPGDSKSLPPVARHIFSETFGHHFEARAFAEFCDAAYGPQGTMVADLGNPQIHWRIAEAGHEIIGYARVRPLAIQAPNPREGAMELHQLYVLPAWHGKGVGEALMRWAIEVARGHGAPEFYLAVFEHNERAKRFYAKHGFSEVGTYPFVLGGRTYEDRLWRRPL